MEDSPQKIHETADLDAAFTVTPEAPVDPKFTGVMKRLQASIADSVFLFVVMLSLTSLFESVGEVPRWCRIVATVIVVFYDPLFISLLGATPGHFLIGLRVRKADDLSKNINLFQAIPRFIVKILLGWISLLTIQGNERGRALHDKLVNSVVIDIKYT